MTALLTPLPSLPTAYGTSALVFAFLLQQLKDELGEVVGEMENMDSADER